MTVFLLTETLNRSIYSQSEPLFLPQSVLPPHWLAPLSPFWYISHSPTTEHYSCLPRTMELTQSSETSAYILRTPGKFPKEYYKHKEGSVVSENRDVTSRNSGVLERIVVLGGGRVCKISNRDYYLRHVWFYCGSIIISQIIIINFEHIKI